MTRLLFIVVLTPALGVILWLLGAGGVARCDFVVASDVVRTIDPQRASWLPEIQIAGALFEGLTRLDPVTQQPRPAAAESWSVSPDGREYVFQLREQGRWSNGDALIADHFRFAWLRALDPAEQSQYASLLFVIDGAEQYYRSRADADPANDAAGDRVHISAHGDALLRVRLRAPCPYFLDLTAFPTFYPNHPPTLQRFGAPRGGALSSRHQWTRPGNIVANGAYLLDRWDFKSRILLSRRPDHWAALLPDDDKGRTRAPKSIEVLFTSDPTVALLGYETGRIDLVTTLDSDVSRELQAEQRAGARDDLHAGDRFATYFYRVNCTRPPLDRPELRRALALALDKRQLCEFVLGRGEQPADTFVPPVAIELMPRVNAQGATIHYRPPSGLGAGLSRDERCALARAELAKSGYDPAMHRPLELIVPSEAQVSRTAEALQSMWLEALGVRVELKRLERKVTSERIRKLDYDLAPSDWYGDYMDPMAFLELFTSASGQNRTGWQNSDYDRLINSAALELDNEARFQTLARAERILTEEGLPIVPLFFKRGAYLLRRGYVGVSANARDLFPLHEVRIATGE